MENRFSSFVYDLMARQDIAQLTHRVVYPPKRTLASQPPFLVERISQFDLGADPKQVKLEGNIAYVTSMKNPRLDMFDILQGVKIREIALPGMPVEVLVDNPRKQILVSEMGKGVDGTNSVIGIDMQTGQIKFRTGTLGKWSKFMAIRPHYPELWISNWLSDDISVINLKSNGLVSRFKAGKTPRGIAFTPNGEFGYVCGYYSRDILKFDADTHQLTNRILMPFPRLTYQGTPRHIVVDSEGRFAYVSNMGRGTVHKLDLSTDKITETSYSGQRVATIALTQNDNYLACANEGESSVTIMSANPLMPLQIIHTNGGAYGLDIDKSGTCLAVASFRNRSLEVFKLNRRNSNDRT